MQRFFRGLLMAAGATALLNGGVLQAAGCPSEALEIPFDFVVRGVHLPAGAYRLERGTTDRMQALVNVRTGSQVQILRSFGNDGSRTRLIFERKGDTYLLLKLS